MLQVERNSANYEEAKNYYLGSISVVEVQSWNQPLN